MEVVIKGTNLPGRAWDQHTNVHVGVQERRDAVDLVPGDATSATWRIDVRLGVGPSGELDFKGPAVHGKPGERFVYLTWGDVGEDGRFTMFRRAKLILNRIAPDLIASADGAGGSLVATVDLTDRSGGPRCARVDPPALSWAVR